MHLAHLNILSLSHMLKRNLGFQGVRKVSLERLIPNPDFIILDA